MSVSNTARRLGKSKRWVYGALAVLRLPAHWQTRVAAGLLTWETTGRLVGLLDRPDVLAAVEADLAANPADWAKKHEVAARLDFVVAQLDNLAKPTGVTTAEVEPISRRPHDVAATEAPEVLAPITRRSAPVDHAQSLDQAAAELSGEAAVLQILALIGRLDSKEQISRVDAALNARDNAITAACRRSSCNRLQDAYI